MCVCDDYDYGSEVSATEGPLNAQLRGSWSAMRREELGLRVRRTEESRRQKRGGDSSAELDVKHPETKPQPRVAMQSQPHYGDHTTLRIHSTPKTYTCWQVSTANLKYIFIREGTKIRYQNPDQQALLCRRAR